MINKYLSAQLYVLSKDSFLRDKIPSLQEFQGKFLIFARAAYPNYSGKKKKSNQELLSWHTTFFSEKYNEGGLNTVFGFSSLSEGVLKEVQTN